VVVGALDHLHRGLSYHLVARVSSS
jgi:hypothetical protein